MALGYIYHSWNSVLGIGNTNGISITDFVQRGLTEEVTDSGSFLSMWCPDFPIQRKKDLRLILRTRTQGERL